MRDADRFKQSVDVIKRSYAVAVKGRTFPALPGPVPSSMNVTVLEASSWAMANCFEIEKKLGKLRAAWYVDGRIATRLPGVSPSAKHRVELFPSGQLRTVHSYKGDLWGSAV
jgi:hypothetical protein